MNQKVLLSSLLISGSIGLAAGTAQADGLPRLAASTCPIAVAAKADMACGNVELLAALGGITLVAAEDIGQVLVDSRRVVAVLGRTGAEAQIADIPIGSIKPAR